jgi:hypothetical protein
MKVEASSKANRLRNLPNVALSSDFEVRGGEEGVKTIFPCPVRLHMEESKAKKLRRDTPIYPHTTVRFMERLTRGIFCKDLIIFATLYF